MKTLFYNMVTIITEQITGISHTGMKLWEFDDYVFMMRDVTLWLNIACAIISILVVVGLVSIGKSIYSGLKQLFVQE